MANMTPLETDLPGTPCAAYEAQRAKWRLVDDVLEGTEAIRKGGETYTPRAIGEEQERYEKRLAQSRFYNLYRHMLDGIVGRVFRRPPRVDTSRTPIFAEHVEDITGTGVHLAVFLRRLFRIGVHHGHAAVLIDAPRYPNIGNRRLTKADVTRYNLRPYWLPIRATQIIDWQDETVNGKQIAVYAQIYETGTERAGRFGEQAYEQWRVLDARDGVPRWEIWRDDGKRRRVVEDGQFVGTDRIPLIPLHVSDPSGLFVTRPALYDVAEQNLDHYTVQTRHVYNQSVASNPIPVILDPERLPDAPPIVISVESGIQLTSQGGNAFWMEHSGSALASTQQTMEEIERRIAVLGLSLMQRRTNQSETAEAKRIESAEAESRVSAWARGLQDTAEELSKLHCAMIGEPEPDVGISLDFDGLTLTDEQIRVRLEMLERGAISRDTLWDMLEEGGALPENFDRAEEEERIARTTLPPVDEDDDDDPEDESKGEPAPTPEAA